MDVIRFYKTIDPFGCFSNFSSHPVFHEGKTWLTSEHYFQAQKFAAPEARQRIRDAVTPMQAAQLGRSRDFALRDDWDRVKDAVMRDVVRLKAMQHADVREALVSTGDAVIVEHTASDAYWADGGDGSGKNMLGLILMEVRRELAENGLGDVVSDVPQPPWVKYPELGDPSDLGWRMGYGEDFIGEWDRWYFGMSKKNRQRYLALFSSSPHWLNYVSREG